MVEEVKKAVASQFGGHRAVQDLFSLARNHRAPASLPRRTASSLLVVAVPPSTWQEIPMLILPARKDTLFKIAHDPNET